MKNNHDIFRYYFHSLIIIYYSISLYQMYLSILWTVEHAM